MDTKRKKTRQNNFFYTCNHCKVSFSCCLGTRPPISQQRKRKIEKFMKQLKMIKDLFIREKYMFPRENPDGYCIFHDIRTKRCVVHPVKPETCVAGPITFDINIPNQKIEWFIKTERICPLAGVVFHNKTLLQKHLKAAKMELSRLIRELSSEELKAILEKEEPETFKIGEDKIEKGNYEDCAFI